MALELAEDLPYDDDDMSIAPKNLHVPFSEPLYQRLRAEAERSRRPATELAREAIRDWLEKRRREALYEAIAHYARKHAGTRADLDPVLGSAGFQQLVEGVHARKKRP